MLNINEVIHMRKVFTIILCIIMVLSLTACGGSDGENSSVKSEGTVGADEKVSADSEATGKTEATGDSKVASDQSAKAGSPEITALENKYNISASFISSIILFILITLCLIYIIKVIDYPSLI